METFPASENYPASENRDEKIEAVMVGGRGGGEAPTTCRVRKSIWFEIAHTAKVEVVGVPGKGNLFYFCLLAL